MLEALWAWAVIWIQANVVVDRESLDRNAINLLKTTISLLSGIIKYVSTLICIYSKVSHSGSCKHSFQYEAEDGTSNDNRPVRFAVDSFQFPSYSWRGYAVFSPIQEDVFLDIAVSKASLYRLLFHFVNPTDVNVDVKVAITPLYTHTQGITSSDFMKFCLISVKFCVKDCAVLCTCFLFLFLFLQLVLTSDVANADARLSHHFKICAFFGHLCQPALCALFSNISLLSKEPYLVTDVEQTAKISLQRTIEPATVAVNPKQPFVLNPGRWRLKISTKQRLFLVGFLARIFFYDLKQCQQC